VKIAGITHRGQVRRENQDAFYTWKGEGVAFGLVCDGMGGARAGNVASAVAAQRFAQVLSAMPGQPEPRMKRALELANRAVFQRSRSDPGCRGMGTTLVAAFVSAGEAHILNVGDSRCYLISGSRVRQVTEDHSLVEELVRMGRITEEEARKHPNRNIITRALGTEHQVQGDLFLEQLSPGDRLLLCSDGLSNEVQTEELPSLMKESLEESCEGLLRLTLERGAPDNVTVVLLEAEEPEAAQEPEA
jgi:protein phosphatase